VLHIVRYVIVIVFLLPDCGAHAQLHIGFSGDFGNQARIRPNSNSLLRSPITVSGSLNLTKQEEINEKWLLQYGIGLGVLGYNILASQIDTLTNDPSFYDRYPNYNILHTNFQLNFGRRFDVKRKSFMVFLGGGASHMLDVFGSNSKASTRTWDGNSFVKVFEYEVGISKKTITGFIEGSIQLQPNHWSIIGLRFRSHVTPSLMGQYSFYHTKDPLSGQIELTSNTLSIFYLIVISKK